jgi:hypothetical protein
VSPGFVSVEDKVAVPAVLGKVVSLLRRILRSQEEQTRTPRSAYYHDYWRLYPSLIVEEFLERSEGCRGRLSESARNSLYWALRPMVERKLSHRTTRGWKDARGPDVEGILGRIRLPKSTEIEFTRRRFRDEYACWRGESEGVF